MRLVVEQMQENVRKDFCGASDSSRDAL